MNSQSPFILLKSPDSPDSSAWGVYKAVFSPKDLQNVTIIEALKSYNTPNHRNGISILLMIGGGHFAAAVISHERNIPKKALLSKKYPPKDQQVVVLQSKTFHRYTTRRKQGGSQSASDNARGKANSAGSSIRRYNEQALKKDVQELLLEWKPYLDRAEHIFIRANGASNRKILVGYEGSVLKNDDIRIKSFPFTTKRATLSEVKSAWTKLSYVSEVQLPKTQKVVDTKAALEKSRNQNHNQNLNSSQTIVSESDEHTKQIIGFLKKSKAPLLISYMKKNGLDSNFMFTPSELHSHSPTPLHYASSQGLHHMVKVLLVNLKADPTRTNRNGKTAAQISSSGPTSSAFQIARSSLGEEYCNWSSAHVGEAKTADDVAREVEEQKLAARQESARLVQESLAVKTDLELKKPTFSSGGRVGGDSKVPPISDMAGLSDQQKMRLMREQRARAAEARILRSG